MEPEYKCIPARGGKEVAVIPNFRDVGTYGTLAQDTLCLTSKGRYLRKVTALTESGEMRRRNMEVSARREDCRGESDSVTWLGEMNAGHGMYWDLHFGTYIHAFYRFLG